jgi:hypothetical protein
MTTRFLGFGLVSALSLVACKSSSTTGGTSAATTTATATTTTTAGAGGAGTGGTGSGGTASAGGAGGQTGAGGACHGDDAAWAKLTTGPIACTKNSDCCVVVNGCISASQVVGAAAVAAAKDAWPYCDKDCNDCIPPPLEVACNAGACSARVVDMSDAGQDLFHDHCGVDPTVIAEVTKLHFSCGDH